MSFRDLVARLRRARSLRSTPGSEELARARALEDALRGGDVSAELRPFVEAAKAVEAEAARPVDRMDANVARSQRAMLTAMAARAAAAAPAPKPAFSWMPRPATLAGGFAVAMAVLVFAVVVPRQDGKQPVGSFLPFASAPQAAARLLIPEASAGDAFSVAPESSDRAGVDPSSAFTLSTGVDVSAADVAQNLRVLPASGGEPVPVEVSEAGIGTLRVTPKAPLEAGTAYRITLAADVKADDGTVRAKEFTWAVQTKDVFRVLSSTPGDGSAFVPVSTAVEFVMSASGWEDPSAFFSIEPKVDGRFEAHGRSLVFLPAKPLANGQLYTARLRKGLAIAGSDRKLDADAVVRFETESVRRGRTDVGVEPQLRRLSIAVGKEPIVPVSLAYGIPANVRLVGYALPVDQAERFLRADDQIPWFASETRRRGDAYRAYAKAKAFEAPGRLLKRDGGDYLALPSSLEAGRYLVNILPTDGRDAWMYLEVTDAAVYTMADDEDLLVWTVNAGADGRPLSGLPVRFESASAQTDAQGLARLPIGAVSGTGVLRVGDGGALTSVMALSMDRMGPIWEMWNRPEQAKTVAYLMSDRPLYRATDTAKLFGLVQDRVGRGRPSEPVSVALYRSGVVEPFGSGMRTAYKEMTVNPDDRGFFEAELSWANLASGQYLLAIRRGGNDVELRDIEVQNFAKPAYAISVRPAAQAVFAGEAVTGEVQATFFDGTPAANLDLAFEAYGAAAKNLALRTDASGRAAFSVPTQAKVCNNAASGDVYACVSPNRVEISVRAAQGEEAEIFATAGVDVWNADRAVSVDGAFRDGQAVASISVRNVDLSRARLATEAREVLGDAVPSAKVSGVVIERTWERREAGQRYDEVLKRSEPVYRYQVIESPIQRIDAATDGSGRLRVAVPAKEGSSYRFVVTTLDAQGRMEAASTDIFPNRWDAMTSEEYQLSFDGVENQNVRFAPDADISVRFLKGANEVPSADHPAFLFVEATNGMIAQSVSSVPRHATKMDLRHEPNTTIYGVLYDGGFVQRSVTASLDSAARGLDVSVVSDKAAYAPGGEAVVRIQAKDAQGNAVRDARVGVAAVDEAVFAAARVSGEELPLDRLYAWIPDGIRFSQSSQYATAQEALMNQDAYGGAEMGGGGGMDRPRANLLDTAAFQVVTTGRDGSAEVRIPLPDNVTGWRVTAVAVTGDRRAGVGRAGLPATKPVFVDAILPSVVLVTDKPALRLRAVGATLSADAPVSFTVDAPTLGIQSQKIDGKAGMMSEIALPSLVAGEHAVTVRVSSALGQDAVVKKLRVVESRFRRKAFVTANLAPGAALPDAGVAKEVRALFIPTSRAAYLDRVQAMAENATPRAESRLAAAMAQKILADAYGRPAMDAIGTDGIQLSSGGIAPLPYASADVSLSSRAAFVAPDALDRVALARYFWERLRDRSATREVQMDAISGLAGVGEAVLPELQDAARLPDLSWRERLAVSRGLLALGDRSGAEAAVQPLLAKALVQDGIASVRPTASDRDAARATAEASVLAAALDLPVAAKFDAWLDRNWHSADVNDLERAAYLSRAVAAAPHRDARIVLGVSADETETIDLSDGRPQERIYLRERWDALRIVSVDGPIAMEVETEISSLPAPVKDLSIVRRYESLDGKPVDLAALADGSRIRVALEPGFGPSAPAGCYVVRDYLPAGLAPAVDISFATFRDPTLWYPMDIGDGAVEFVTCRGFVSPIRYVARVTSRGQFMAEPAMVQSLDAPSVSAVSEPKDVQVR